MAAVGGDFFHRVHFKEILQKFSSKTVGRILKLFHRIVPWVTLFSSPEHKVLMVSFCDRPMSGVRRASSGVHNFFKHLLLLNHWANLDETWQGCSMGEALPKLFKRLNSTPNSGCHGNQKEKKLEKSLKIFFSESRRHRALIFSM